MLVLMAVGCPSAKTVSVDQLPASGLALRWDIGGRFGGETLRVDHDGSIEYRVQRDPTATPEIRRGKIKRAVLAEVLTRLAETNICDFRSQRVGEPDEARGTLTINAVVFGCSVELWDNEWHAHAPVAQDMLDQLRNATKVSKVPVIKPPDLAAKAAE